MPAFLSGHVPTEDVTVPCVCDGNPHEHDTVTIKARFSGADISIIDSAKLRVVDWTTGQADLDLGAANRAMMTLAVVGWSFTNGTSEAIPFDSTRTNDMDGAAWAVVCERAAAILEGNKTPLPKSASRSSGVPRRASSTSPTTPSS